MNAACARVAVSSAAHRLLDGTVVAAACSSPQQPERLRHGHGLQRDPRPSSRRHPKRVQTPRRARGYSSSASSPTAKSGPLQGRRTPTARRRATRPPRAPCAGSRPLRAGGTTCRRRAGARCRAPPAPRRRLRDVRAPRVKRRNSRHTCRAATGSVLARPLALGDAPAALVQQPARRTRPPRPGSDALDRRLRQSPSPVGLRHGQRHDARLARALASRCGSERHVARPAASPRSSTIARRERRVHEVAGPPGPRGSSSSGRRRRAAATRADPSPPGRCRRPRGGTGRSTAWDRRRRRACRARASRRASAPRRDRRRTSSSTISAWSGSVSWNSSTKMCVKPPLQVGADLGAVAHQVPRAQQQVDEVERRRARLERLVRDRPSSSSSGWSKRRQVGVGIAGRTPRSASTQIGVRGHDLVARHLAAVVPRRLPLRGRRNGAARAASSTSAASSASWSRGPSARSRVRRRR